MIELGDKAEYEVEVVAVIGVKRTVRVTAMGDAHARIVAKEQVQKETDPQVWTFDGTGETVTVPRDRITSFITGMCPTQVD